MNPIASEHLARIDALQLAYADALDSRDMAAWLETFSQAPEASYLCTTAESMDSGLPVALIMDDRRTRLEDRVTFVEKVWKGTYQAYQTRHIVQRVRCVAAGAGIFQVKSNFIVGFSSDDGGVADLLTMGIYLDEIDLSQGEARFLSKKAITDTAVLPHYIVYPL